MREIKYRGWFQRHDGSEYWVYGYYYQDETGNDYITDSGSNWCVCEDTVSQFTGMIDKNDAEIFGSDSCLINGEVYKIEYIEALMTWCPFTEDEWQAYQKGSNHFKYCWNEDYLVDGTFHFLSQICTSEIELLKDKS